MATCTPFKGWNRYHTENLKLAGVQQAHKEDRITFTSLTGWPGKYICAEGRYLEGKGENAPQKRAAVLIGPEFGTVSRPDLVAAARFPPKLPPHPQKPRPPEMAAGDNVLQVLAKNGLIFAVSRRWPASSTESDNFPYLT